MYQELTEYLCNTYGINSKIFEREFTFFPQDIDLEISRPSATGNLTIPVYYAIHSKKENWQCIVLDINPKHVLFVAERLNAFFTQKKIEPIDIEKLRKKIDEVKPFRYSIRQEDKVVFVYDVNPFNKSSIHITK